MSWLPITLLKGLFLKFKLMFIELDPEKTNWNHPVLSKINDMASPEIDGLNLNVYSGPDSLKKYFNPDFQPPLPLVELPQVLNPFHGDGVRIYAKMMSMHPANNVKAIPALNLLAADVISGKTRTIIEYSSGSTVVSMSMIARVFHGVSDVRAFLSNKTSDAKLKLMQFFGLGITLFGGPSQPEPLDDRGGIRTAQKLALESDEVTNPNQYENDNNWGAHVRWTGPQILKQLPEINIICAGMGTSGTMTGLGTYFKEAKPSVLRLGVCTAPGDRVPGPRSYALLSPVQFPWKSAVDMIEEVGSSDSYTLSLEMCREGLICGPSSGFNLKGLYNLLEKRKSAATLSELAGTDGTINCVFMCCDLPYQYIQEYFDKLGPEQFHPISNERLRNVDLYRYDEKWERNPIDILGDFFENPTKDTADLNIDVILKPGRCVIDLRQPKDFDRWHLPGAVNIPLSSLEVHTPSPFADPAVLEAQWLELEELFSKNDKVSALARTQTQVMMVCYTGDTARVATSVLRAKDVGADSVRGGWDALINTGLLHDPSSSTTTTTTTTTPVTGSRPQRSPASIAVGSN